MAAASRAGPPSTPPPGSFRGVDLAILLPTLNEVEGLRATYPELPVEALRTRGWNVRALIVDGGSTDGTLEVAREFDLPVLTQRGHGKGAAIQEALDWLHREGVAYAIVLDADCTYPGSAIAPMAALLEAGSDVVVGVRYPAAAKVGSLRAFVHEWGNAFLNFSASILSRRPILDLCSGLWGVRVAAAVDLRLVSSNFEVEAELFVKAYRRGLVFAQIPITYRKRVGEAKLRAARDGIQIFRTLLRWSASPGRGPLPEPVAARRQTRLLLTIAFVHEVRDLVLRAAPDRKEEAEELLGALSRAGLRPTLAPLTASPDPLAGEDPAADGMTIALPARAGPARAGPSALVSIPYRHRVVVLGGLAGPGARGLGELQERGYRYDGRVPVPALRSPLQAAHASVTSRRPRQETALLRANAYRTEILIFQQTAEGAPVLPRAAASAAPDGGGAVR